MEELYKKLVELAKEITSEQCSNCRYTHVVCPFNKIMATETDNNGVEHDIKLCTILSCLKES